MSAHVVTTAGPEEQGELEVADRVYVGFRDGDRVEAAVIKDSSTTWPC